MVKSRKRSLLPVTGVRRKLPTPRLPRFRCCNIMGSCRRCYIWMKYAILQGDGCSTALWRYIVLFLLLINLYAVYHHVDHAEKRLKPPPPLAVNVHGNRQGDPALVPMDPNVVAQEVVPEEPKPTPGASQLKCKPLDLGNPSFEKDTSWLPYEPKGKGSGGFTYDSSVSSHGKKSIKVTKGGAFQNIQMPAGTKKFVIAVNSRNKGITKAMSSDYSVWCDVKDKKEKWIYGMNSKFLLKSGGALHDWHERKLFVKSKEEIGVARCYCMFRNYPSGEVWFDNVRIWTVPEDVDFNDCTFT